MARRKFTLKQRKKIQNLTLRKKGGARTEIASLFDTGGYPAFDWSLYYISGHGGLNETMFEIPDNTYVLNIATTGKGCAVFNWDIERMVFAKDDTPASLDEQRKVIYNKLVEGLTKNTTENAERIYTGKDIRRNIEELYNQGSTREGKTTLAFYEPGDYMFDTSIFFRNSGFPLFLMGIYTLPIKQSLWKRVIDANKPVWKDGRRPAANYYDFSDLTERPVIPEGETYEGLIDEGDQIFNVPENLARDIMYPNGTIFPKVSQYETYILTGEDPLSIPINKYRNENINKIHSTLFPNSNNNSSDFITRLMSLNPPAVNEGLVKKPTSYPFLTPARKVPTLSDIIQHLNHDDTHKKLIIVHTCRSIDPQFSKINFTPSLARRMSIATRERSYPKPDGTARLRSQLRRKFLEDLLGAINRRIAIESGSLKTKLESAKGMIEQILKEKQFNFRLLRDTLRKIHSEQLVKLQDKFVELLQLDKPLPVQPVQQSYPTRLLKYLQTTIEKERKQKEHQMKIQRVNRYTEDQEKAIFNFMGEMISKTGGRLARNPDEMKQVYWDMVDKYVRDSDVPYLGMFPLDKVLAACDHRELIASGIDITPNGIITV